MHYAIEVYCTILPLPTLYTILCIVFIGFSTRSLVVGRARYVQFSNLTDSCYLSALEDNFIAAHPRSGHVVYARCTCIIIHLRDIVTFVNTITTTTITTIITTVLLLQFTSLYSTGMLCDVSYVRTFASDRTS